MSDQLPLFEGHEPHTAELKLSGAIGTYSAMAIGDTVEMVVKAECIGVNHERKGKDQILVRSHKLNVVSASVVVDADFAAKIRSGEITITGGSRVVDSETGEITETDDPE